MAGNYKPTEEMQAEYNKVINPASTPNQIAAALKTLASLGSIRLQNMDERYKALAGKHVPNLITPEAMAAAEHLGLNTKYGDPAAYARLKSLDSGGQQFTPGIPPEVKPASLVAAVPQGALNKATAVDGKTTIYQMPNGTIQDATGQMYDQHGNLLHGVK